MGNEQQQSEQTTSTKQENSNLKTDQAEVESAFQLRDLSRLIFRLTDGRECDVWSSTASDFQSFVGRFGNVENVDVTVWSVFDRLDYVNGLWQFCQGKRYRFPFTVKQPDKQQEDVDTSKKA